MEDIFHTKDLKCWARGISNKYNCDIKKFLIKDLEIFYLCFQNLSLLI